MGEVFITRRGGNNGLNANGGFPMATYTGSWSGFIDDGMNGNTQNWKAKFYTSGILAFTAVPSEIDVFLVGGGGAGAQRIHGDRGGPGGGGGWTLTSTVSTQKNTEYQIIVGAGGVGHIADSTAKNWPAAAGGDTIAFGLTAKGGEGGAIEKEGTYYGGSGGSGGGGSGYSAGSGGDGGSDGSDGEHTDSSYPYGDGQGTTTREFGETEGTLYAGGGGGGERAGATPGAGGEGGGGAGGNSGTAPEDGEPNTGGGGGGGSPGMNTTPGGNGGSGIVVIRNHRR